MPSSSVRRATRLASARELIASNLVVLRRAKGWSQEELAYEAGLHRTFVAHVERQVRNIAIDNVEKLAHALGVEVYELLMPRRGAKGTSA